MSRLLENLAAVSREVSQSAAAAGRAADEVKLLVISKTRPLPLLQELYDSGIREFGESREPELAMKAAALPGDIIWHFIGPLQSNKVRKVVLTAQVIHSVSQLPLISRLDRISGEENKSPEFLLEVNVSGEASKGGFASGELAEAAAAAAVCRFARFRGLMTMAPLNAGKMELMEIFSTLRQLRDECESRLNIVLPVLSMGMSGDFKEAIASGSTVVRVGSRIFEGI